MAKLSPARQRILALDIGGTGLKASLIDGNGKLIGKHLWLQTPHRPAPKKLVKKLVELAAPLTGYTQVAAGFPGVIRRGVILTSPTLGNPKLNGFNIERPWRRAWASRSAWSTTPRCRATAPSGAGDWKWW